MPAAPILDIGQALDNPFVAERGGIQEFPHPVRPGDTYRMAAHPVRSSGDPAPSRAAPALGEYTDDILRSIGYDAPRIRALRQRGVI